MAVSGGLYLFGVKGSVQSTPVFLSTTRPLVADSGTLESDVRALLSANGIDHDFEYIKVSGKTLITRPTSANYFEFTLHENQIVTTINQPDLIKTLVELHKGHGPLLFKDLQKLMALGLLIVLLSGFWLGVSSTSLRVPTLMTTLAGLLVFLGLGFTG